MARLGVLGPRIAAGEYRTIKPPPKVVAPFYSSPEWRALMAKILRARGRKCEDTEHDPSKPRMGVRIFGDHIKEIRDGGAPLDPANVMLRCAPCHMAKTARERGKRAARKFE